MSPQGTAAYDGLTDLPPLVERAVGLARRLGFANSCRPEHGRLLHALDAAELRLAPDLAALVATRRYPAS
jgi:hypothetical protein